jgi:shikimate kinase
VARRSDRPLLHTDDPRATLETIMHARYPIYAESTLTVTSYRGPIEQTVERVYQRLLDHFSIDNGAQ